MNAEELLQSVPLFHSLDRKHVERLAKGAHERTYTAGESIVNEGESGIGLFVVSTGQVEVSQNSGGQNRILRSMGPGEVFGELALLTDHTRTASVRATQPTTCLVVTSWNFRALLDEAPEMGKPLAMTLAQRLVETEDRAAARQ